MIKISPRIHSDQLLKVFVSFSVHLPVQRFNTSPCGLHGNAVSRRRSFASAGAFYVRTRSRGTQMSLEACFSSNFGRSNKGKLLENDLEVQLQELLSQIKSMIKLGNKNDALALLQANFKAIKEEMDAGDRGIEVAAILDVLSLGYMGLGDYKVVGMLLEMINEIVNGLRDDEPLLESVLTHMGSMYSALGKFKEAILSYGRAIEIIEVESGRDCAFVVLPLLGMGKVFNSMGRSAKAADVYRRAIAILESQGGAEIEELIVPSFALGNLLMTERKCAEAEHHFNRILNICMTLYGEDDGRVGMAMCSVANAKCAQGHVDEAILIYRKALQLLKDSKRGMLDNDVMERMRIDLAELLHAVGRQKEGRELLEECILVTEKHKGKDDPSLITHLMNLATSYSRSKNYVEAERLLRTSLHFAMKRSAGPEDPSVTFPMLQLAITLYNLNRDEEAEGLAVEVLHVREKVFGKDSPPVGEALDCLVPIYRRLEKDDDLLLYLLKRILKIQERVFGCEGEEVIETLKKIVFYLDKTGRRDEKSSLERRLSLLRNKQKQKVWY